MLKDDKTTQHKTKQNKTLEYTREIQAASWTGGELP